MNTWFGAVTGSLPPLMGWAAQTGQLDWNCVPIFLLLYFWQLPHFFAIAWMYRDDYRLGDSGCFLEMISMVQEPHFTCWSMVFCC